jgi:uncharacterized protein (TIGR04255 family)
MYEHETFPNAPITEALINVRATFGHGVKMEQLEAVTKRLSGHLPQIEGRTKHNFEVKVEAGKLTSDTRAQAEPIGFVQFSETRDRAVQVLIDGFTFSKMKPYENWNALRDEARSHWEVYRELTGPSSVVRLAVRYINRIELPLPLTDFQEYVLTGPKIADGIPQGIIEFLERVVIPNKEDPKMMAVVTSTMERIAQDAKVLPYIFDIDAFKAIDLKPDSDDIWAQLEALRDYKNLIFFESMADKAKELFR